MMHNKKLVTSALFVTTALMLSYIESLFPFFFGVPGMKLGLANLAVVIALYFYGWREALTVNALRILLAGILFGNLFSVIFSFCGALVSFFSMVFVKRRGFSLYGVSMVGGVAHNMGQLLAAAFIVKTFRVGYYVPVLLAAGLVTGLLNGILGRELSRRLPKN